MKTGTFRKTPARPLLRSLGAPMDKAQATSPRLLVFPLSNIRPLGTLKAPQPPVCVTNFLMAQDKKRQESKSAISEREKDQAKLRLMGT